MDYWRYPYYSYKILPLVYDEALSYWEQIVMLCGKINDLIKIVNSVGLDYQSADAAVLKAAKEYADTITNKLQNDFDSLSKQINQQINEIQNDFDQFIIEQKQSLDAGLIQIQNKLDYELNDINQNLAALWIAMNYLFYQQDDYMQKIYKALKEYIDETIAYTTGGKIMVINPILGSVTTLNKALDDVLQYIAQIGAITMAQYDSLHLTMAEYDNYKITMRDYSLKAYFIFFERLALVDFTSDVNNSLDNMRQELAGLSSRLTDQTTMVNPYHLQQDSLKSIFPFLVDQTAPTFYEYNSSNLTFDFYNNTQLTEKDYREKGVSLYFFAKDHMSKDTGSPSFHAPFVITPEFIIWQMALEGSKSKAELNHGILIGTLYKIEEDYLADNLYSSTILATNYLNDNNSGIPTFTYGYVVKDENNLHLYVSNQADVNITWIIKRNK